MYCHIADALLYFSTAFQLCFWRHMRNSELLLKIELL